MLVGFVSLRNYLATDAIQHVGVNVHDMDISKNSMVKYWEEFLSLSSRGSRVKNGLPC